MENISDSLYLIKKITFKYLLFTKKFKNMHLAIKVLCEFWHALNLFGSLSALRIICFNLSSLRSGVVEESFVASADFATGGAGGRAGGQIM